jgi:hypothetical protein
MAETMKTVVVDMGLKVSEQLGIRPAAHSRPADADEIIDAARAGAPAPGAGQPPDPGRKARAPGACGRRKPLCAPSNRTFPDQAALDRAIDALDPTELQRQAESVLAPIVKLIVGGQGLAREIRREARTLYPADGQRAWRRRSSDRCSSSDLWGA